MTIVGFMLLEKLSLSSLSLKNGIMLFLLLFLESMLHEKLKL
jgi:hypothetical protein